MGYWLRWTGGIYVSGRLGILDGRGYRVTDSDGYTSGFQLMSPVMAPRGWAARDYGGR